MRTAEAAAAAGHANAAIRDHAAIPDLETGLRPRRTDAARPLDGAPDPIESIRKPLWTIMASTHALQRSTELPVRERRLVDRIDASVERLLVVLRDLVEGRAVRAGQALPLFFRTTDVRALASRVADAARIDRPDRTIWCVVEGGGTARWDVERMEQVLSSLVDHVLDAEDPGAVTLCVRADDEQSVSFEVEADGSPAERPHASSGSLRLVIARHVVRAHGGRMIARRAGAGDARFELRLPRDPGRTREPRTRSASKRSG